MAFSHWTAAAQYALVTSLYSLQNNLQTLDSSHENNILKKTKDAVETLKVVMEGKHNKLIDETLNGYQVPADNWWSALYKVVEGLAVMSRLARNRLQNFGNGFEDTAVDWDHDEN